MTSDEFLQYLPLFYIPEKWANLGIAQKDIVDFTAAISTNCNTEVLVNSVMSLFSQQGILELVARVVGIAAQIPDLIEYY